jgi:subtilisin family serine protease
MRNNDFRYGLFSCLSAVVLIASIAPAQADGGGSAGRPNSLYAKPEINFPSWNEEPDYGPPPFSGDERFWRDPRIAHEPFGSGTRNVRPPSRAVRLASPPVVRTFPPPLGEQRFRSSEVLVELAPTVGKDNIDLILRRHRLTESEAAAIPLLGATFHLWRIPDGRNAASVIRELSSEPRIASAQPNYVYVLQQDATTVATRPPIALPQYALGKLHIDTARTLASGDRILVAVVDTAIDETHPDLLGAVEARFDAVGGAVSTRRHGTAIAGAIAAHERLQGVAPKVRLLAVRAFEESDSVPEGTTLAILKGIDWAAQEHARVVNMSFAGPQDPAMHRVLAGAYERGIVLVAAAGNAGRNSAPLYPAADEKVLAVTATDEQDKLFENANVGRYIAVSAPGVDVLLPAPNGSYELETGTSVSAALVSGVAALIIERLPNTQPAALRRVLMTTATPLGGTDHRIEFGAGLVNAFRALSDDGEAAQKALAAPAATQ